MPSAAARPTRPPMGFRPAFWPTVITVAMVLALLGLGVWQLERLHWKEALIAARTAGIAAAPVGLPTDLAQARSLEYHRVRARGEFLNDREFFVGASDQAGTTGYHVVTPFRLADGALLLVDRGWIPSELKDRARRAAGEPSGTVDLEGVVRIPVKGWPRWLDWALPDNDCARNYWFWIDVPGMARCGGLAHVLPFSIDAGPAANPGGYPRGGVTRVDLPNHHLQYAITWFALAGALVVIYILQSRRQGDAVRGDAAKEGR